MVVASSPGVLIHLELPSIIELMGSPQPPVIAPQVLDPLDFGDERV